MVSGFNHIDMGNNVNFINIIDKPVDNELSNRLDDTVNNKKILYVTMTTRDGKNQSFSMNLSDGNSFSSLFFNNNGGNIVAVGFEKVDGTWYFRFNIL